MSRVRSVGFVASTIVTTLLAGLTVQAQTARSGSGANTQLLQQLQQLASERTSLQAEAARAKKELEDARKERDDLKKAQQAVEQRAKTSAAALAQSASERAASEQELTQTKAKMEELIAKFRETLQTLRQIEAESASAKQTLATRDQQLKVCVDRNASLYKLNGEILTHLEHESAWSHVARSEPFTKIKRVQLENLADDYQARADDQRVSPGSTPLPPASRAPQSSPASQGAPAVSPAPATPVPQPDGDSAH
jgi:chromosome segregation ATPase